MNKKGFTLIELLVTISVLALISLVIGVNITSILRSTEKQNENFDKEQIEKAACVYYNSETLCPDNNCTLSIANLIESGLLDEDVYKDKSGRISIKIENDETICEYKE